MIYVDLLEYLRINLWEFGHPHKHGTVAPMRVLILSNLLIRYRYKYQINCNM